MDITAKQLATWINGCKPIAWGFLADAGGIDRGNFYRELQKENPSIKPKSIGKIVGYLGQNGIGIILPAKSGPKSTLPDPPDDKKGSAGRSGAGNKQPVMTGKRSARNKEAKILEEFVELVDNSDKLLGFKKELAGLGKGQLADKRRKWLEKEIKKMEA